MRGILLSIILIFTSIVCIGQQLQQGIFTTVTLGSYQYISEYQQFCWGAFESDVWINGVPYATGMNLYLRIDSLIGASDSIQVYRSSDSLNAYAHANDMYLINNISSNGIQFNYLAQDTLYISLLAVGTPAVNGENYFCYYSLWAWVDADGCSPKEIYYFAGGNNLEDSLKNCRVLPPLGISEISNENNLIYPNPATDYLTFSLQDNYLDVRLIIYSAVGAIVHNSIIENKKTKVDVTDLAEGLYIVELKTENKIIRQKLIKQPNRR